MQSFKVPLMVHAPPSEKQRSIETTTLPQFQPFHNALGPSSRSLALCAVFIGLRLHNGSTLNEAEPGVVVVMAGGGGGAVTQASP